MLRVSIAFIHGIVIVIGTQEFEQALADHVKRFVGIERAIVATRSFLLLAQHLAFAADVAVTIICGGWDCHCSQSLLAKIEEGPCDRPTISLALYELCRPHIRDSVLAQLL